MFVFLLTAPMPGSHRGKQMKFYTFRRSDEFQTLSSPLDFDFFQFEPPRKVINCLYNVRFPPSQRADCFRLFQSRIAEHHIIIKYYCSIDINYGLLRGLQTHRHCNLLTCNVSWWWWGWHGYELLGEGLDFVDFVGLTQLVPRTKPLRPVTFFGCTAVVPALFPM